MRPASTLATEEVLRPLGRPEREAHEPEFIARAYAQLYDQRAGAIEVEFREGCVAGITLR